MQCFQQSILLSAALVLCASVAHEERLNVLLIMVDDLRPQLGCYGHDNGVKAGSGPSPHIDALAESGVLFENAFTNYPFCAPSRNSFMSGRAPDTTKAWNFLDHFRETGPSWTTLPEHFKKHGYYTGGSGKLFHPGLPPNEDNPRSWSIDFTDPVDDFGGTPNTGCSCNCFNNKSHFEPGSKRSGCTGCELDDDIECSDVLIRNNVTAQLHQIAKDAQLSKKPFFLAMGLHKPHLPWGVPKRFWDLQPPAEAQSVASNPFLPVGMPPVAYHSYTWAGMPYGVGPNETHNQPVELPRNISQHNRRGYHAAVSFTDDNVGQALTALDQLGYRNNTVVLLTGDHGWQLGEHLEWCKQTLFDVTLRVPFIIRAPGAQPRRTTAFAELLDMYRTLAELAGVPLVEDGVQGSSLADVVMGGAGKQMAFSQMARCHTYYASDDTTCSHPGAVSNSFDFQHDDCERIPRQCIEWMGYSVRTSNWRYTEWVRFNGAKLSPDFAVLNATELYQHSGPDTSDFGASENENVANDPHNAATKAKLSAALRARFA